MSSNYILYIIHKLTNLWCYVPVLLAYVRDSLDEFVDELPHHVAVLLALFPDYPHEVVVKLLNFVPAPSGV